MKKPNVTYAEIYVRDLLIERDSAAFYRNLLAQLTPAVGNEYGPLLRQWARLDDELEEVSADGWLPTSEGAEPLMGEARISVWVAYNAALAAETKARLYYEGAKKRSVDPHAIALAEKRIDERNQRIERLQSMISGAPRPRELETAEEPHAHQWLQQQVNAFGGFRFVHSEAAA